MGSPFGRHAASAEEIATLGSENDLRFFVDPLNPLNAYLTVNAAYAAAIARLPAGTDVIIELAPNMIHAVAPALVVATDRNLVIKVAGEFLDSADLLTTSISGTITLPDASGEPARRNLFVTGLRMDLIVNQATSWNTIYKNLNFYGGLTLRTNGANGCNTTLNGCRISSVSTMFRDADANAGLYVLIDTQIDVFAAGAGPHTVFDMSAADETSFRFYSCNIIMNNMMDVLSLVNAGAPPNGMYFDFYDTNFNLDDFGGTTSIIEDGNANIYTTWVNTTIFAPSGDIIIGVDDDDPVGWPKYVGEHVPVNPKPGMLWVNPVTGREAIYQLQTASFWKDVSWDQGEATINTITGDAVAATGSFATITQAYTALKENVADDVLIRLRLAPFQTHVTAGLTLLTGNSVAFEGPIADGSEISGATNKTILSGTLIQTADDASTPRRFLAIINLVWTNSALTMASNWDLVVSKSTTNFAASIARPHGAKGCVIFYNNSRTEDGSILNVTDVGAAGTGLNTSINIRNSRILVTPVGDTSWLLTGLTSINILQSHILIDSWDANYSFIDFAGFASKVDIINSTIGVDYWAGDLTLFENAASVVAQGHWLRNSVISVKGAAPVIAIGLFSGYAPDPLPIVTNAEPASVPTGTKWTNPTTGEILIWNGTYWTFNKSKIASLNHSNVGATMIVAHTLITNTIYKIKAEIVGRLRDGPPSSEFRSVTLEATCTHLQGAAAAVVGAVTSVHDVGNGASAGWTMTLAANGDDIELQATTGVAESCDWKAKISWEEIATLA